MATGDRACACVYMFGGGVVKWGHLPCATSHWLCFLTSANTFEIQEPKFMSACVCVHVQHMYAHTCAQACMCVV